MRDHTHSSLADLGYCEHCGQPLPVPLSRPYGSQGNNKYGIAFTIGLHLVLVLLYVFRPSPEKHAAPPNGATMVLLAPLNGQAKPKPAPQKQTKQERVMDVVRLPNTITLPNEKPLPVIPVEIAKPAPPQFEDMQAQVEARRRARALANGQAEQPVQESEGERALRIAKANIAAANGRSAGDDANDTGGVFEIANQTFHSAEVKFRGWKPSFKRRWLQQVTVEQGTEIDLETAIIKKMIELIRKEKKGDFIWEQRNGHQVNLSARVEDTAELQAFLFKEMFPNYRPPRR